MLGKFNLKVILWIAILVATVLTARWAYSLSEYHREKKAVQTRVDVLNQQVSQMSQHAKQISETVTVEQKIVKVIPPPPVVYKRADQDISDDPNVDHGRGIYFNKEPITERKPKVVTKITKKQVPNPVKAEIDQQLNEATIELEAQGFKLKMINEATWEMIFKLCFLWAFVLTTLGLYKRLAPKTS